MGKPGFPSSQPLVGAAGTPHRQGDGETGFPQFPTAGGSGWHPPQAGVRFDRLTAGGETGFPRMFTSGTIRGAHNARMKIIFLFLGGLRPPKPSRGRAIFTSVMTDITPSGVVGTE